MLKRSLFQLVAYYISGAATAELQRIRAVHRSLDIPASLFDTWLEVLLDTVARFDPEADETTRLAWCWALAPGITYMRMTAEEELIQQNCGCGAKGRRKGGRTATQKFDSGREVCQRFQETCSI